MAAAAAETSHGYVGRSRIAPQRGSVYASIDPPTDEPFTFSSRHEEELPGSDSYTHISKANTHEHADWPLVTSHSDFSASDCVVSSNHDFDSSSPSSSGWITPEDYPEIKTQIEEACDASTKPQKRSKVLEHRFGEAVKEDHSNHASSVTRLTSASLDSPQTESTAVTTPSDPTPRVLLGNTFSRGFNRRSWAGSDISIPSRSPSPPKQGVEVEVGPGTALASTTRSPLFRKKSVIRRKGSTKSLQEKAEKDTAKPANDQTGQLGIYKPTVLRKKARAINGLFTGAPGFDDESQSQHNSRLRSKSPLPPKSSCTDRIQMTQSRHFTLNRAAHMPRLVTSEKAQFSGLPLGKRKDELWSIFRSLDGDFTKFASKSVAFKANVVRSSLLPFLRMYAAHPSNRSLKPEDLDRRTNILNKWWTGLIEMLHGQNNQSISGTDRPAILDGISGIMERPEWRLPPSPFCALNQRTAGTPNSANQSTTSIASNSSDFFAESVHHNVRNIFVQNLSSQMVFVVDKMSVRNAPASLVSFCGKACAYAFIFVPGMADLLVRLWDLQMNTIQRVLAEAGIGKFDDMSLIADLIVPLFPPALQQLSFSSLMKYMRKLRTPPPLPLGTADVQWSGHWLERWSGRESDLFYVFVKYFHILVVDFLPSDATKEERLCAPGVLPVHAQILTNLDATIHREANQASHGQAAAGVSPTFDEVLGDLDTVVSTIPMPPTNAVRLMAENRLIMLIRDFLSERAASHPAARQHFAESFNDILQVAARGTSAFDHTACYTLLDFLEEAFQILVRFEQLSDTGKRLIDPAFWQTVCRRMLGSHNTMTEIRLYAFLYTVWNTIIADVDRKVDLCINFLLDPDIFESRFNHWCPMVRAYYMRLLCWRVARFDGENLVGDAEILETLLERLQTTWCHYLYLRFRAESEGSLPPPTTPCNPAPSRRLLIMKTDTPAHSGASFHSFDGVVSPTIKSDSSPPALNQTPLLSSTSPIDCRPGSAVSDLEFESESRGKGGIGSFLRGFLGSKPQMKSQSRSATQPLSGALSRLHGVVRSATDDVQLSEQRVAGLDPEIKAVQASQPRKFFFKFSLEFIPNSKSLPPMRLMPPRLPLPAHQFLQDRSQIANKTTHLRALEPTKEGKVHARYCSRALVEWNILLGECQSFFDRRKHEGLPNNRSVETPALAVEVFRRPG